MVIYLIGFMASGKTKTGKVLAQKMDLDFYDLDKEIEQTFDKSISELFDDFGEEKFRILEQNHLHKTTTLQNSVISCGGGTPCFFNNMEVMNFYGTTVFLDTDLEMLFDRLKNKKSKRPLIANKTDEELKSYIENLLNKRLPFYQKAKFTIENVGIKEKNALLIKNLIASDLIV